MQTAKFTYWEEDGFFVGHFLDYPDYWTQGTTFDDLKEHLRDLYSDRALSLAEKDERRESAVKVVGR